MSEAEDVELPKRQPQQALDALRDQPPFVTPWPVSPGVSGWFHPPDTSCVTAPGEEWPAEDEDETETTEQPTSEAL